MGAGVLKLEFVMVAGTTVVLVMVVLVMVVIVVLVMVVMLVMMMLFLPFCGIHGRSAVHYITPPAAPTPKERPYSNLTLTTTLAMPMHLAQLSGSPGAGSAWGSPGADAADTSSPAFFWVQRHKLHKQMNE